MSDRVPVVALPGLVAATYLNVDTLVMPAGPVGEVVEVFLATTTTASGDLVVELNDATGGQIGGANGLTITIVSGAKSGTVTGSLQIDGSQGVYLRVVTGDPGGNAKDLSGWFLFSGTPTFAALTTLALVKQHAGITVTTHDALLTNLIAGVSDAMQQYMRAAIVETAHVDKKLDGTGDPYLMLPGHPILTSPAPVVRLLGTVVDDTSYELDEKAGLLVRVSGGAVTDWQKGVRNFGVDYSEGYSTVPASLVTAATKQVRHEFHQSKPSTKDRLGENAKVGAGGGSTASFVPDGFLPSVREAMEPFVRDFF